MANKPRFNFKKVPKSLKEETKKRWNDFVDALGNAEAHLPESQAFIDSLSRVWPVSHFVSNTCRRHPTLLFDLFDSEDILTNCPKKKFQARIQAKLQEITTIDDLCQAMRNFRNREMVRIAWRSLAEWSDLANTSKELSVLADVCIEAAVEKLYAWLSEAEGIPYDKKHSPQALIVIALGKLGGNDLNFSSDIDLIFGYPSTEERFFTKLSRQLIKVLNEPTGDGFVFRTDLRLRPYGSSGPVVMSIPAIEEYYRTQGRDWERYALIKSRLISGDYKTGMELLKFIHSFVYRPYLDYSAIEALREMKDLIAEEVKKKGMQNHIKLGPGGIREIEFICQKMQLIRGGHDIILQSRNIYTVFNQLKKNNLLSEEIVDNLQSAYRFLRNMENHLQMIADKQTHDLPKSDVDQDRLAYSLGFADWDACFDALKIHRDTIEALFNKQTAPAKDLSLGEESVVDVALLWKNNELEKITEALLKQYHFENPKESVRLIRDFKKQRRYQKLSRLAQRNLHHIITALLKQVETVEQPSRTLRRLFVVIEAIMQRSIYLILVLENPEVLSQLVKLCASCSMITSMLASYPTLLDELRSSRVIREPSNEATLSAELRNHLESVDPENLEQLMERLRQFKLMQTLRIAIADITDRLPLMKISDHITYIATVILRETQEIAWKRMLKRYDITDERTTLPSYGFSIIGYGKLGGIELGYSSDLDLVFLYDDECDLPPDFFSRLAQQILLILNTRTSSGVLYEVDTRLRPSGRAGLLVSSFSAFAHYQREQAWTWEHQALVRARVMTGQESVGEHFNELRKEVLSQPQKIDKLSEGIVAMREKMRAAVKKAPPDLFDLKQGHGGITDIEFIAQYSVLRWGSDYPSLLIYPDNIRIFETLLEERLMTTREVNLLCDAYREFRKRLHHLDLAKEPHQIPSKELKKYRNGVIRIWKKYLFPSTD